MSALKKQVVDLLEPSSTFLGGHFLYKNRVKVYNFKIYKFYPDFYKKTSAMFFGSGTFPLYDWESLGGRFSKD